MTRLEIRGRPAGTNLYHLELYNGDTHIGDYERSTESEIWRKREEIERSTDLLLSTYAQHGKFAVRWNGRERIKEIRKYRDGSPDPGRQAPHLGTIPRRYWA